MTMDDRTQEEHDMMVSRLLLAIYKPWAKPPSVGGNGYWEGEVRTAYCGAFYNHQVHFDRSMLLLGWFRENLDLAFANNFWDLLGSGYVVYVRQAQAGYQELLERQMVYSEQYRNSSPHVAAWRDGVIADLPAWLEPSTDPEVVQMMEAAQRQYDELLAENAKLDLDSP